MRHTVLCLATLVSAAAVAPAAADSDPCTAFKWPVRREKQAFEGTQLPILKSGAQYPGVMAGATVALDPQERVSYPVPPGHKPRNNPAHGAVVNVSPLAAGGTYQVTLSDDAWVDLVQNGKLLRSTSFTGATGCPGIRKSVRFKLDQGPLLIEISDAGAERVNLDMLPAEAE